LHPPVLKTGKRFAAKYRVTFRGQVIAHGKDAECDAARWLHARGYSGALKLIDGSTGKHRLSLDIKRASRLTAEEGGRFVTWRERGRFCAPRPETQRLQFMS
jgi:hypothetical protein